MYREDKATELAAHLIKKASGHCNYLTLLTMLYFCDRELVLQRGVPATYDTWYAMSKGPVLSRTLDLIKGNTKGWKYWQAHIVTDGYEVVLVADPGDGALSDAEIEIADRAFEEFGSLPYAKVINHARKLFEEWQDPEGSRREIKVKDILQANRRCDREPAETERQLTEERLTGKLCLRPLDSKQHSAEVQ